MIIVVNMDRFVVLLPVYSCEYMRFTQLRDKYIIHDNVNKMHLRFPATINSCNSPRAVLLGCAQAHLRFLGLEVCMYLCISKSLVSC